MLWGSGCRGEKLLPHGINLSKGEYDYDRVSCTKKALPAKTAMAERAGYTETQITFCSIHLPRTKRTQKNSERMAQSRNMPIQMNSRPQWNLSTIR